MAESGAQVAGSTNYRELADSILVLAHNLLREGQLEKAIETMAPGYESAKRLNDLELLHHYAVTYAEAYSRMQDDALASYYTSLGKWYSERLEKDEGNGSSMADNGLAVQSEDAGRTKPAEKPPLVTGMQAGTIGILVILILLLIIENIRLRKRMRDL